MVRTIAWGAWVAAAAVSTLAGSARAALSELEPADVGRLLAGQPVVREDTVETTHGRYIGGVAYVLVNAPVEVVAAALDDVQSYTHILPYTRGARWIGLSRTGDLLIALEQGNALAQGRYTMRVHRERDGSSVETFRFWLDDRFSHDIADVHGFFQLEPLSDGRSLLTYVALVDLGPGFFRHLFEDRVRRALLSTPVLVRGYIERQERPRPPGP